MNLHDKTALVTGASQGIGEQFARQLAARGANLVLVARRADQLAVLATSIQTAYPDLQVETVASDLSVAGSGSELFEEVSRRGVHVDLLVNNAGVGSHDVLVDQDPVVLAREIQLNVTSLVDLTARFLPAMVQARFGGVVNIASTAAFQPVPTMAVYAATKAFVLSFTEALWGETRGTGVRVLTVAPGATQTAFFANTGKEFLTKGRQTPDQVAAIALRALDGRTPTVVPGLANKINAGSYRFLPRAWMVRISGNVVKPAAA